MSRQVAKNGECLKIIKKSKFIGFCYPINSANEAKSIIADMEIKYRKANHVCWAYRVFDSNNILGYSSDAGEPGGSAGPPILSAIEGRKLINTLCLVVRYFGGIKLGVGGLIRAYRGVAAKVLDESGIKIKKPISELTLITPQKYYSNVMSLFGKYELEFEQNYRAEDIIINIKIEKSLVEKFKTEFYPLPEIEIK